MITTKHIPAIALCLLILACNHEVPDNQQFIKTEGVFVLNEGNFTYGNASLSFLDVENNTMENQVFFRANGFPLGDVASSMEIIDTLAFICVNYSGKVFAIHANTFEHLGTISGLVSPRFFLFLNDQKAYISDLYSESITIVNPRDYSISGTLSTGCTTEQMLLWSNYVFVLNWSFGNKILKIDSRTDEVIDSLGVTLQPNSIVMDNQERIWVLSDGGYQGISGGIEAPALTCIDPDKLEILATVTFPNHNDSPHHLQINSKQDTLFFISGGWDGAALESAGIYKMSVHRLEIPDTPLVAQGDKRFYSLGIDPESSIIYASDSKDYLQPGFVYRYNYEGQLIDSLQADRIPGFFAFKTK